VAGQPVAAVAAAHRVHRDVEVAQVLGVAAHRALVDGQSSRQVRDGVRAAALQQLEQRQHARGGSHHLASIA